MVYCAWNRLTIVSMELGSRRMYQISATPLSDDGKTQHNIALFVVKMFTWVMWASMCSSKSVEPS